MAHYEIERPPVSAEVIDWLGGEEGRQTIREIVADGAAPTVANIQRWRAKYGVEHVSAVLTQIELRKKARNRFSKAEEMLFDAEALEQATGETVARHKAARFDGFGCVADLCCGIGGDALAIAEHRNVIAVDQNPAHVAMAVHNARIYGAGERIRGECADVTASRPQADAFHIDPSRRGEGRRRHSVEEAEPSLAFLNQLVKEEPAVAMKLSPAVAYESIAHFDAEIELISEHGECKQAVAWCGRLRRVHRRATVLPSGEQIEAADEAGLSPPARGEIREGCVLVEPDAAVIRAHLVGELARRYDLRGIDPALAYLVGEKAPDTTLAASFHVIEVGAWSLSSTRQRLRAHDIGRVDIKTRGFAAAPEELAKRLNLSGKKSAILFVTRIREKPMYVLCTRHPVERL